MSEHQHRRRGGFVLPIALITLGVVFLLNSLNALPWNVWDLVWRLWPVLLIAVGLDILFGRRSFLGSAIGALLIVLVILAVMWWVLGHPPPPAGEAIRQEHLVQALEGAVQAEVEIDGGAAKLRLEALEDSPYLLAGDVDLRAGQRLERRFTVGGGVARLELDRAGIPFAVPPWRWWEGGELRWDLALTPDVPLELRLDLGSGGAEVDLTGLDLIALFLDAGSGDVTLIFPAEGHIQAAIEAGSGDVTLVIPARMAARIVVDEGSGDVDVDRRFERTDDTYTSEGYTAAESRLELEIDGGSGDIIIR